MSRVSRVQPHLSEAALKEKIAAAPSARIQQKWMIVYVSVYFNFVDGSSP